MSLIFKKEETTILSERGGKLKSMAFMEDKIPTPYQYTGFYNCILKKQDDYISVIYITDPKLGESIENSSADFIKLSSSDGSLEDFLSQPSLKIFEKRKILILDYEGMSFKVVPIIGALSKNKLNYFIENFSCLVPGNIIRRFVLGASSKISFFLYTSMSILLANSMAVLPMVDSIYSYMGTKEDNTLVYKDSKNKQLWTFDGEEFECAELENTPKNSDEAVFIRNQITQTANLQSLSEAIEEVTKVAFNQHKIIDEFQRSCDEMIASLAQLMVSFNEHNTENSTESTSSSGPEIESILTDLLNKIQLMFQYSLKEVMLSVGEQYSDFVLPEALANKQWKSDHAKDKEGNKPLRCYFDGVNEGGND